MPRHVPIIILRDDLLLVTIINNLLQIPYALAGILEGLFIISPYLSQSGRIWLGARSGLTLFGCVLLVRWIGMTNFSFKQGGRGQDRISMTTKGLPLPTMRQWNQS